MRIVTAVFVLLVFLTKNGVCNVDTLNTIIPKPLHYTSLTGNFEINQQTIIYVEPGKEDLKQIGEQLSDKIFTLIGLKLQVIQKNVNAKNNYISLTTKNAVDSLGNEGYKLISGQQGVVISGKNVHGVFYGMQSLVQLIGNSRVKAKIASVEIYDKPQFVWRGLMLDVGRYFYSVEFIKKTIDNMARYKMNTFHWHLTEDQGWRIEIKKYPELTTKGAWRSETQMYRSPRGIDKNPHGGFYTQEQVKEVVKYAQSKFITVVPEIEMPGHSLAALSVFPELSCTGGPFEIPGQWRVEKDVYCAGNEKTFKFLEDVLTEVVALFPGNIIHIGGDECPKDRWKACPKCQARIKKEGLKDEHELQSYFIKRIEQFLLTKNKNIIGWDEILEGGLAPNAMVMSWRGTKGGIEAARQKHDVVMSPSEFMYLDFYQGEPHLEPYSYSSRILPIQKVYSYEPIPDELNASERKYIKGVQSNVWTEHIHSEDAVQYMMYPRVAAVAEVAWTSPRLKNWEDFSSRVEYEFANYEKSGTNYAKSIYNVWCEAKIDSTSATAKISLKTYGYKTEIRYTLDGTEPTVSSKKYIEPFDIKLPQNIKAATFKNGKRISKVNMRTFAIISSK
ncbi:beta-N-acetylhexosaminidase [Pseudopedobacter beijingensis]|uniref:beta-N-acetylhexosaminidase n=1 Tax=Pseudopedobacter beijingensis TaxID=1207056 RepID=A0ABW4I7Q6_9SPHI